MKTIEALVWKFPGVVITMSDETIIQWEHSSPKPDAVEIEAIKQEHIAFQASILYQKKRAAEYPPIADQLDAIWKGGAEMESMRASIMAVKTKFPKP